MEAFLRQNYQEEITNLLNDANDSMHVSINVDLTKLQHSHADLFDDLLTQTHSECKRWDAALLAAQKQLLEGNVFLEACYQIKENCHVRFVRLPKPSGHQSVGRNAASVFPTNDHVGRFVEVKGNVVRMTQAKLLECRREYLCGRCKRTAMVEAEYAKMFVIEAPRTCVANPDGQCKGAPYQRFDQPEAAHCIDFQEIRLQELLNDKSMPASVLVTLDNDLVDACQPGDCITVCGTIERRWRPLVPGKRAEVILTMRAISVAREEKRAVVGRDLPEHLLCVRADWQEAVDQHGEQMVRDEILQSFCPEVHGMYLVKLALVLALSSGMDADSPTTSCGGSVRGNSHVILVGDPGLAKSKLLQFAARIATRAVHTTGMGCSAAGLTAAAVKEDGEWQLEAGALVLADGGVCCIDEFNLMRESDKSAIHEAMEQQTISMAKAGLVCKLSTRCVILAATNPKRPYIRDNDDNNLDTTIPAINIGIAAPLLSRFDIVLILRDQPNEEWDCRVCDHLLSNVALNGTQPPQLWSIDKLQTHFMAIRDINPVLTPEASDILGSYYKACRAHPARDPSRTTVRLLDSIMRLAQAHARLVFRSTVTALDAVTVVRLMECSWGFGRLLEAEDILRKDLPLGPTDEQLFEVRRMFDLVDDCDAHVGVSVARQPTQPATIVDVDDDDELAFSQAKKSKTAQENNNNNNTVDSDTLGVQSESINCNVDAADEDDAIDFHRFAFNKARMDRLVSQKLHSQRSHNTDCVQTNVSLAKSTKWSEFSGENVQSVAVSGAASNDLGQMPGGGRSIGRLSLAKKVPKQQQENSRLPVQQAAADAPYLEASSSIGLKSLPSKAGSGGWSQTVAVGKSFVFPVPGDETNPCLRMDSTMPVQQSADNQSQPPPPPISPKQSDFSSMLVPLSTLPISPAHIVATPSPAATNAQNVPRSATIGYATFLSAPFANNDDLDCLDDIDF